jgi:hypothetical protein
LRDWLGFFGLLRKDHFSKVANSLRTRQMARCRGRKILSNGLPACHVSQEEEEREAQVESELFQFFLYFLDSLFKNKIS